MEDVYHLNKYDTHLSVSMLSWSWIQLWVLLAFTMDLFLRFGVIGFPGVLVYGLYLFVSIFSITSLMDKVSYAPLAEVIRFLIVLIILISSQWDWFAISAAYSAATNIVFGFSMMSLGMAFYFHFFFFLFYNRGGVLAR